MSHLQIKIPNLLRKFLRSKNQLAECLTDESKLKFADSQIAAGNALLTGGILALVISLLNLLPIMQKFTPWLWLWPVVVFILFMFAALMRYRGLRLIDLMALKKQRRKQVNGS